MTAGRGKKKERKPTYKSAARLFNLKPIMVFTRNVTFFSRYTCVGWPHKIEVQLEATAEHLEDDEERFQKNLLNEQNTFQDRLDALNMVIAGFSAHTDINK